MPVKSVDKALEILECFLTGHEVLRVREVASMTGLSKATVSRVMATMESRGWLERDSELGSYRLGIKAHMLGGMAQEGFDLAKLARPFLEQLRDQCGEEVALHVLRGSARVCVARADSRFTIAKVSTLGSPLPLHCGAAGKVLLAYLPLETRRKLIYSRPLQAFTPLTITDPRELEKDLEKIAEQGYALSDGEREEGAYSVVAPVFDVRDQVVASLVVSGPSFRLADNLTHGLIKSVMESADELSAKLGHNATKAIG
ncbi:MAG TPA: hypothetical protein DER58_12225 [Firmicutes bacterium]|jgi:DNA-binding IclR family transcriptional regulator|nr:hypothetical protein [Bacillota bacterium]HCF93219.1 hypothetical protein [Bacillota bacterium]